MSGRLLPLAALLLAAPAAAQFYPEAPPRADTTWADPFTPSVTPVEQIGYPFDAMGEYVAPDGSWRGIYLELDGTLGPVIYLTLWFESPDEWPDSGRLWVMGDLNRYGTWQTNELHAHVSLLYAGGRTEKLVEVPQVSLQGHLELEYALPPDPPVPGEMTRFVFTIVSTVGASGSLVFLVDEMLGGLGLVPVANEPEPAESLPITLTAHLNPLRAEASFTLTLARPQPVRVALYDLLGREVAVVHEGTLPFGLHRLALDAAALPAGVYVARAVGTEAIASRTVTVVR